MHECNYDPSDLRVILDEEIAASKDNIDSALIQLVERIGEMECARGHLREIELALAEALANALVHGNREDPSKHIHIWAGCARDEQIIIAVTDEGEGFTLDAVPNPTIAENIFSTHGRGIYLMNCLMDSAEHRLGGRQVVMRKRVAG